MTVLVRMSHLRAAGMCNREPRQWFKAQGLSWSDFVTTGISSDVLLDTGDPLAARVVAIALKETDGN